MLLRSRHGYCIIFLALFLFNHCSDREYKNIFDPESVASNEWMPKNLQIRQHSMDEIIINWRKIHPDITGFVIDRRINESEWENDIALLASDETTWTDTSFLYNSSCYYRIFSMAESQRSAPAFISINPVIPAPTNIELLQINDITVKVTWADPSQGKVTFIINRMIDESDWESVYDTLSAGTSEWLDSSLVIGQTVHYKVSSFYKNFSSLSISDCTLITFPAPENFNLTVMDTNSIKLQWETHSFNNILGYTIERKTDSGDFMEIATIDANQTEYIDQTIEKTHAYSYKVSAVTSRNRSKKTEAKKIVWKGPYTHIWSGFHNNSINTTDLNSFANLAVSGGVDKTVKIWDLATGNLIRTFTHSSYILKVRFNTTGTRLLSADNYVFKLWDTTSGTELFTGNHTGNLTDVQFSDDGQYIISCGGTSISLWNATTGANLWTVENYPDASYDYQKTVSAISISHDNSIIAACGDNLSKLNLWDLDTKNLLWSTSRFDGFCLQFCPDNSCLLYGGRNTIGMYGVDDGQLLWSGEHNGQVTSLGMSPTANHVLSIPSVQQSSGVKVWNLSNGSLLWENTEWQIAQYNPTGKRIAAAYGSWDGITIEVISSYDSDTEEGNFILIWQDTMNIPDNSPNSYINSLQFSENDNYISAGGGTGEFKVWKYGWNWEVSDEE